MSLPAAESTARPPWPVHRIRTFTATAIVVAAVIGVTIGALTGRGTSDDAVTTPLGAVLVDAVATARSTNSGTPVEVQLPHGAVSVGLGAPLRDVTRGRRPVPPPDGGAFRRVWWSVPSAAVPASADLPPTTLTLVSGATRVPLASWHPERFADRGDVMVAVPGEGTGTVLEIEFAGEVQRFDGTTIDAGRMATISHTVGYDLPTARIERQSFISGRGVAPTSLIPWMAELGWAPAGRSWLVLDHPTISVDSLIVYSAGKYAQVEGHYLPEAVTPSAGGPTVSGKSAHRVLAAGEAERDGTRWDFGRLVFQVVDTAGPLEVHLDASVRGSLLWPGERSAPANVDTPIRLTYEVDR